MDGKVDNLRKHNTQKKKEPMKKTYEPQWKRKEEKKREVILLIGLHATEVKKTNKNFRKHGVEPFTFLKGIRQQNHFEW